MTVDRTPLFVDTSALIALLNPRDQYHAVVAQFLEEAPEQLSLVTSNFIFGELLSFFCRHENVTPVIEFQEQFFRNPRVEIVWVDRRLHAAASALLKKYADQKISFTDAVSFAIMQHRRLRRALAFDDDFIHVGFETVPKA